MNIKETFQLGVVIKDDRAISHRSLLKILVNPFLRRFFGIAIGSIVDDKEFKRYSVIKQKQPTSFSFKIDFEYDYIL